MKTILMKAMTRFAAGILPLLLLMSPASLMAQEVSVAPPPLAYPDYTESGSFQSKVTATYINVSAEDEDLTGAGVSFTGRSVLDEISEDLGHGIGFGGGIFGFGGDNFSGGAVAIFSNYERELFDSGDSNFIGFGGLNFSDLFISSDTFDIEVVLFGFQVGGQYSVEAANLIYSPWFMFQSVSGTVFVNDTEFGVDATATILGFDILHVPSGVTLGGILQQASGDDSDTDVLIIQISWTFGPQSRGTDSGDSSPSTARFQNRPASSPYGSASGWQNDRAFSAGEG